MSSADEDGVGGTRGSATHSVMHSYSPVTPTPFIDASASGFHLPRVSLSSVSPLYCLSIVVWVPPS